MNKAKQKRLLKLDIRAREHLYNGDHTLAIMAMAEMKAVILAPEQKRTGRVVNICIENTPYLAEIIDEIQRNLNNY